MLSARPAEGNEHVVRGVVSLAHGDAANRLGHAFVGDVEEAGQDGTDRRRVRVLPELSRDFASDVERRIGIDRDTEALRIESAEEQVASVMASGPPSP
jgi:hypothetical protein